MNFVRSYQQVLQLADNIKQQHGFTLDVLQASFYGKQ